MCNDVGFLAGMMPGNMLIVPARYLVISAVTLNEPCEGLRWSTIREKRSSEAEATLAAMRLLLASMAVPPKATDDMMVLKDALEAD